MTLLEETDLYQYPIGKPANTALFRLAGVFSAEMLDYNRPGSIQLVYAVTIILLPLEGTVRALVFIIN